MPGRHSLESAAITTLNSPVGRSATVALVAGTILGVALPAAQADQGSAAGSLAPTASATPEGTTAVTVASNATWSLEQVSSKSAVTISAQTKADLEAEAAAEAAAAQAAAQEAAAQAAAAETATATAATATAAATTTAQAAAPAAQTNQAAATAEQATAAADTQAAATPTAAATTQAAVPAAAPAASGTGSAVVAYARQFVGAPYVHGGTTPAGWDCSGYLGYVYRNFGVSLPRTSGAIRNAGRVVSAAEARPGDILWWPGHVAIYEGGNMQIAATNPTTDTKEGIVYGSPVYIRVLG